jgi:hypothetical protein
MSSHSAFTVPPSIPAGGATGTVLTKKTASDYDTDWEAAAAAGGLTYKGDWVAGSYNDGDIVVYNGVSYQCVRPTSAAPVPWAQAGAIPNPPGALMPIADILLPSPQTVIDIQNIPQIYESLVLHTSLRTTDTGTGLYVATVQLNGDAGANYDLRYFDTAASEQLAGNGWGTPFNNQGASLAGQFAQSELLFENYASTNNLKTFAGATSVKTANAAGGTANRQLYGWWRSTAAINRITIGANQGQWAAGCRVTLFGVLGSVPASSVSPLSPPIPTTTLPASPLDNQQAILVDSTAAPTFSWLLQWSTAAARWNFIGGDPFEQEIQNSVLETSASTTYVNLTTLGPQFTVPRSGRYLINFGMLADTNGAAGGANQSWMAPKLGAATALDADGIMTRVPDFVSIGRAVRRILNAGDNILCQYHTVGTGQIRAQSRWMTVQPSYLT